MVAAFGDVLGQADSSKVLTRDKDMGETELPRPRP